METQAKHRRSEAVAALGDAEIIERVRGGEHHLFELLMRRHNQRHCRTARAVVRDEAEAEDVVQEAWVKAFAALGAKVRLHRARASLRRELERRIGAEVRSLYGFDGARCDRIVAAVLARLAV